MHRASTARKTAHCDPRAAIYPADLQPALQDTLAILADIDFRFAQQREQLAFWHGPESDKESLADELDREHRRAREPYVQMLAELQRQMMTLMGYPAPH